MDEQLKQGPGFDDELFEDAASAFPGDDMEQNFSTDSDVDGGASSEASEIRERDRLSGDSLPEEGSDHEAMSNHDRGALPGANSNSGTFPQQLTALTMGDFEALEERVLRAVTLIRRERQARLAAEERLLLAESQMLAAAPLAEQLQQENDALRAERDQVRLRVERLLSQLDSLEV